MKAVIIIEGEDKDLIRLFSDKVETLSEAYHPGEIELTYCEEDN